jgi:hypothetical protein
MIQNYNIKEVRSALKNALNRDIVAEMLKNICNVEVTKDFKFKDNKSFSIAKNGLIKDFGSTNFTGDIVAYMHEVQNIDLVKATKQISNYLNLSTVSTQNTNTPIKKKIDQNYLFREYYYPKFKILELHKLINPSLLKNIDRIRPYLGYMDKYNSLSVFIPPSTNIARTGRNGIKWQTFGSKIITPYKIINIESPYIFIASGIAEFLLFELLELNYICFQTDAIIISLERQGELEYLKEFAKNRKLIFLMDNDKASKNCIEPLRNFFENKVIPIDFENILDTELSKGYDFRDFCNQINNIKNIKELLNNEIKAVINIEDSEKEDEPLSPFISQVVKKLANINNYPQSMVLSTVLTAMGGLIGARAKISNNVSVNVFPTIWNIIIAPSSLSAKSTLFEFTQKAIFGDMQKKLYEEFKQERLEHEKELQNFRKLTTREKENLGEPKHPKIKLHIFQEDGTMEAKLKTMVNNKNGGVIFYNEMKSELEKTNNKLEYKALKTSIFDGKSYHKELVNGGTLIIDRPALSEIGLITEQWLMDSIEKNDVASGFMARYLFSYNKREDFKPLQMKKIDLNFIEFSKVGEDIIKNLGFNRDEPIQFILEDEAYNYLENWFNEFSINIFENETDEEITASYRLSTYVLKFALISYIFNNNFDFDNSILELRKIPIKYIKEGIYIMNIFRDENHKILELFQKHNKLNFKIEPVEKKVLDKLAKTSPIKRKGLLQNIRGLNGKKIDEMIQKNLIIETSEGRAKFISLP